MHGFRAIELTSFLFFTVKSTTFIFHMKLWEQNSLTLQIMRAFVENTLSTYQQ